MAAVIIGAVVYLVRPDKIETHPAPATQAEVSLPTEGKSVATIPLDEAFELFKENKALFVDARHGIDYDAGHIQGAINLYADEADIWLPDFLAQTDPQTQIITYCDGEACHLAPELAELLFFNGFDHVFYLTNGWTRWKESGYPVE